jgi:hypothetical protein
VESDDEDLMSQFALAAGGSSDDDEEEVLQNGSAKNQRGLVLALGPGTSPGPSTARGSVGKRSRTSSPEPRPPAANKVGAKGLLDWVQTP